ncbi:fibronectin type III domain-containing protein [Thiothrix fructosivorans]|uniref:Fibronectin type III domain-containing protein n=1 Tax=Thiothrix fructosivorans TaxID=111770 RepID=A0A8B0SIX3_9GAMM|nr:fibronectin type III domain-containing protein [Thiothrix fructosivorans]MBO0612363.1 fibronectin type III domain-containing protein [Thiothrix fructosivorans]QTX12153.1 fibronectin type III domain-containing protein [Thiothrix fructosivorans]
MHRFFNKLAYIVLLVSLLPQSVAATTLQYGGIVLTFDDWFVDQWHTFFTDLKTTNPEITPTSTFFVAHWLTDLKGVNQGKFSNDSHYVKLKQLENAGHEIASHGINHMGANSAPYNLVCDQATQYVTDEVQPTLTAMAQGDPGLANDNGFIPKSFSYPFGERSPFYDNAVKTQTGLRYVRGTLETNAALPLKDTNAIYHKRTGASYPYLIGDGLDTVYQNDVAEVKAALDRASANDEVITLYAHRILPPGETSNYGIAAANLKEIILYAHSKGLTFYRFSDAFAEAPETTSTCGGSGDGGTGNPDSITLAYAEDKGNNTYRVGLQWTNLPNDVMYIALASQPSVFLSSASTGGAASGKIAMNVPNVVAGAQYVAIAYAGSTQRVISTPFVILAGNPPPPPPPVVVAAPTNLMATATTSNQVNLSWTDNSMNETSFAVGCCTGASCSTFVVLGAVNPNVTTYTDGSAQPSTTYRYRVVAYSGTTASTSYPVASVTTPAAPPTILAPPSNLAASVVNGTQVALVWTDNSSNETGFQVERCLGETCTNFALIKSLGANVTTFSNTGLTANQTYRYRVRAYQGTTNSAYTTIIHAQTLAKPTALTATAQIGGKATLTWADSNLYETGFSIERCQGGSCTNFTAIATVGANVLTFSDSGLVVGTRYRYRVRATHASGGSAYSTVASVLAR